MNNGIMLHGFEWYCSNDGSYYRFMKDHIHDFKSCHFSAVWLPQSGKCGSTYDVGYGIYDLFDLGEFDQKGSVRTKYGTKAELIELIEALRNQHIQVISDVVLNHKAFADEAETFLAVEVDGNDRNREIGEAHEIEGYTKFTFNGRNHTYNDFTWNYNHFTGVDYDQKEDKHGIFRIIGENKGWNWGVSKELGNYDYLMFANIDHAHPEIKEHLFDWAMWYIDLTKVSGFRMDAVKHIDHEFLREWVQRIKEKHPEFFIVGEYWIDSIDHKEEYLTAMDCQMSLFDVKLHNQFHQASHMNEAFDLRTLFDGSLLRMYPSLTVTFVDNHDSQPHQSLESWVETWFKPHAYASILLQKDGYPCVFYGDLYGVGGPSPQGGHFDMIQTLSTIRYEHAYGDQWDLLQNEHTIGWVRTGDQDHPNKLVVVINNFEDDVLNVQFNKETANKTFKCLYGEHEDVLVDNEGHGVFKIYGRSIAIYLESN